MIVRRVKCPGLIGRYVAQELRIPIAGSFPGGLALLLRGEQTEQQALIKKWRARVWSLYHFLKIYHFGREEKDSSGGQYAA